MVWVILWFLTIYGWTHISAYGRQAIRSSTPSRITDQRFARFPEQWLQRIVMHSLPCFVRPVGLAGEEKKTGTQLLT